MNEITPKNIGFYAKELRSSVPQKARKAATYKLFIMSLYSTIAVYLLYIGSLNSLAVLSILSVFVGLLYASIFTYCHELSHNTIIKGKKKRYPFEIIFWSINYMPPTLWRIVHNYNHHVNANTYNDSDRRTFKSEKNNINLIYNLFVYPNKKMRYSLMVGFGMIIYTWKQIISVFYPGNKKPKILTFKPNYSRKNRIQISFELSFILLYQIFVFLIVGSFVKYLLVTFISYLVSSAILNFLIMTQHLINPHYVSSSDPVLCSTSVKLNKFLDFLVNNHSYHTEHHIFPSINFDYYPDVSKELEKKFPQIYNRKRLIPAIKEAYEYDVFIEDPYI